MITTCRRPSRARTISRTRWDGRPSTIRRTAASSARSGNGWTTGRSYARSVGEGSRLVSAVHELQNLPRQPVVRRIDGIDLRHVTVLRQNDRTGAAACGLAARLLELIELVDEARRVEFGARNHQWDLRELQTRKRRALGIAGGICAEIGDLGWAGRRCREVIEARDHDRALDAATRHLVQFGMRYVAGAIHVAGYVS